MSFDADDLLDPRLLEAYSAALRARPDLDIVTCDAYLESGGVMFDRYYRSVARFAIDDQRRAVLHQHFIFGFAAIARASVEACGGWEGRHPDTDLWVRLILNGAVAGSFGSRLPCTALWPHSLSDDRARNLRRDGPDHRTRIDPSFSIGRRSENWSNSSSWRRSGARGWPSSTRRSARARKMFALAPSRSRARPECRSAAANGLPRSRRSRCLARRGGSGSSATAAEGSPRSDCARGTSERRSAAEAREQRKGATARSQAARFPIRM